MKENDLQLKSNNEIKNNFKQWIDMESILFKGKEAKLNLFVESLCGSNLALTRSLSPWLLKLKAMDVLLNELSI